MEDLRKEIECCRAGLREMVGRKRILVQEIYELEYEQEQAREEVHKIQMSYWPELLRLDRLERTLRGMIEEE